MTEEELSQQLPLQTAFEWCLMLYQLHVYYLFVGV